MATLNDIKAVASAGIVVSLPHAAGMQSSLPILQKNYKFSKVFYWGKMMGMKGDYLIAKGIEESSSTMKFFYCTDGVSWAELPLVTPEMQEACFKVATYGLLLSGDISAQLQIPVPPLPEGAEPPAEEVPPQFVTELQRLAVTVMAIEMECALCPAGALMKKVDHTIVPSPTYVGASFDAACAVKSYVYMNKPKHVDVNASATKAAADFLTPASDCVPAGSLTTSFDAANNVVAVRSLLYPGFITYNFVGMPIWGNCYSGNGLKNVDIAFMLP